MHDSSVSSPSSGHLTFRSVLRPFINHPSIGYELVLIRSDGVRTYDRRIAVVNATDAADLRVALPSIEFISNDSLRS